MHRTSLKCFVAAVALVGASACQTMTDPEKARVIANPTTPIVKTMTSFSSALRCMDDLFAAYGKRNLTITSDGIPDETGKIQLGTKEIMISTISKMSTKSDAFRFVDVEQSGDMIFWMNNKLGLDQLLTPDYYIRGSITQADTGVSTDSQGGGIGLPFLSLGYSQDQMLALVSMDLNMGETRTRRILPGLHTSNTITIMRSGSSGDAEGLIGKGSVYLEIAQDQSQGTHQAVRTLLELSLIETLGKFTKVPYWRCLQLDSTNPSVIAQARDWYDQFNPEERVRVIQTALISTQDYSGAVDGRMSPDLQQAVNRYKAREDLIANGRIDFDMYLSLLSKNVAVAPTEGALSTADQAASLQPLSTTDQASIAPASAPSQASVMPQTPAGGDDPIGLELRPVGGGSGVVRVGDSVQFRISVRKPADVYCYYEGHGQPAARIFPSRFQPEARVNPGQPVTIPPSGDAFSIVPSGEAVEQVACIATSKPYSPATAPPVLEEGDLTPLSVQRIFRVVNQHLGADNQNSSIQHLRYQVRAAALTN